MKYIIITDLDGTLLDHTTYSFERAKEALAFVREHKIPVVICTSKTQAEIEVYREKLENKDPFIPENGGAIVIPEGYFKSAIDKKIGNYIIVEMGIPYKVITDALHKIRESCGIAITGFSDLTPEKVSFLTGIDIPSAKRAKQRCYSEPISIEGGTEVVNEVRKRLNSLGFNFMEGGRFHHIFSLKTDKGKAVKELTKMYKDDYNDQIKTIGIGDSLIDLPMLAAVDVPILVKKNTGDYDKKIQLPNLVYADGIGPEGWNKEILKIFKNI
ncbi:MAG: HAD-IIB family hydrolase [Candidatus Kuenenia sp.]|nr:HAD-IIB family hydrolase [Candidatus Kuenenia hertensis]